MKRERSARLILSLISVFLLAFSAGLWGVDAQDARAAVTCPVNMTSYWLLDETAGATFLDSVGGHDAVCNDTTCPDFTAGRVGNALLFNGVDDAVKVPADASFNWKLSDSFTIEFWMKTDSTYPCVGNQVMVGRDDSSTDLHWWIGCWDYSGVAAFRLRDTNGTGVLLFGSTPLNNGQWHHIVAVRNSATGENSLFVDGRLEDSIGFNYSTGFGSATSPINIGWLNLAPFYHFAGTLDEIALYDRAITETEIRQHYIDGAANTGYCTDDPPAAPQITSPAVSTSYQ
ncbi:MAG: LamG domain-containing protein, partial [Nitrospirae bacterium]|nr:LamG domain-containing protein [Nitrospirota bacterium]